MSQNMVPQRLIDTAPQNINEQSKNVKERNILSSDRLSSKQFIKAIFSWPLEWLVECIRILVDLEQFHEGFSEGRFIEARRVEGCPEY